MAERGPPVQPATASGVALVMMDTRVPDTLVALASAPTISLKYNVSTLHFAYFLNLKCAHATPRLATAKPTANRQLPTANRQPPTANCKQLRPWPRPRPRPRPRPLRSRSAMRHAHGAPAQVRMCPRLHAALLPTGARGLRAPAVGRAPPQLLQARCDRGGIDARRKWPHPPLQWPATLFPAHQTASEPAHDTQPLSFGASRR